MNSFAFLGLCIVSTVASSVPKWEPTYNMSLSTIVMPCNFSGYTDAALAAKFGIVDFDWSNSKALWANTQPMDCEERLVEQARRVKAINDHSKVFVYRNLVKALPWYSSVRAKMLDPNYSGWFLKFKPGGAWGNGTWHMNPCSTDKAGTKCSPFYHDLEQTPQPPQAGRAVVPSRTFDGETGWYIYNNTNDVSGMHPGWRTIRSGGPQRSWRGCQQAAAANGSKIFTYWPNPANPSALPPGPPGTCWLLDEWTYPKPPERGPGNCTAGVENLHVTGYHPTGAGDVAPPSLAHQPALCADGICDCGPGLPCGEYLWDHRNQSLRQWLVDEFVLGSAHGLGNANVDGFFFDDGWSDKANPVPSWAPPTYRQCDMAQGGGATEEDYYCTVDMGLDPTDVEEIRSNWTATMNAVTAAVDARGGWVFQQLSARAASIDLADPRPTCAAYMRKACVANSTISRSALSFEFTRKLFHDPFPLPYVTQDVAMFLLVRGPFAWIGYSWMGCNTGDVAASLRPKEVEVDYGVPVDDHCVETAPGSGIFERQWSKASVTMDCNTWEAKIVPSFSSGSS